MLFETEQEDSWYVGNDTTATQTINPEALLLPLSRGYGVMKSLHLAASDSAGVMNALKAVDGLALSALSGASQQVADLLFAWAGVSGVKAESGGQYYNQQYIAFMEKNCSTMTGWWRAASVPSARSFLISIFLPASFPTSSAWRGRYSKPA